MEGALEVIELIPFLLKKRSEVVAIIGVWEAGVNSRVQSGVSLTLFCFCFGNTQPGAVADLKS
jgi:hypothetical protein